MALNKMIAGLGNVMKFHANVIIGFLEVDNVLPDIVQKVKTYEVEIRERQNMLLTLEERDLNSAVNADRLLQLAQDLCALAQITLQADVLPKRDVPPIQEAVQKLQEVITEMTRLSAQLPRTSL